MYMNYARFVVVGRWLSYCDNIAPVYRKNPGLICCRITKYYYIHSNSTAAESLRKHSSSYLKLIRWNRYRASARDILLSVQKRTRSLACSYIWIHHTRRRIHCTKFCGSVPECPTLEPILGPKQTFGTQV